MSRVWHTNPRDCKYFHHSKQQSILVPIQDHERQAAKELVVALWYHDWHFPTISCFPSIHERYTNYESPTSLKSRTRLYHSFRLFMDHFPSRPIRGTYWPQALHPTLAHIHRIDLHHPCLTNARQFNATPKLKIDDVMISSSLKGSWARKQVTICGKP